MKISSSLQKNTTIEIGTLPTFLGIITFLLTVVPLFNYSIFNIYSSISLFLYFGLSILCLIYKRSMRFESFAAIFITSILLIVSLIYSGGGLGRLANYITSLLFIEMSENFIFDKYQLRFLRLIALGAIIFLFLRSFAYASAWYYYQLTNLNPNTLGGACLFCTLFILCSNIELRLSKRVHVAFSALLLTISVYTMINLRSRACLLSLLAFVFLSFIPKKLLQGKRLYMLSIVLVVIGILVPVVYLNLFRQNYQLFFLGKSLYTGRQVLWAEMLTALNQSPLNWLLGVNTASTALSSTIEGIHGNAHNDYYITIYSFGLVAFVSFEANILIKLKRGIRHMDEGTGAVRYWIYMFICTVLILGYSESVTHWAPTYLFAFLSLGRISIEESRLNILDSSNNMEEY